MCCIILIDRHIKIMTKYPILTTNEIIEQFNEWKIKITKSQLTSPKVCYST